MKKAIFLLSLFLITAFASAQEIKWMTFGEATAAQKKNPKKILVDAYTVWCGPCKLMDKNTFGNEDVIAFVNANFYPVKFNAEGNAEITHQDFTYTNPSYDPAKAQKRNSLHLFAHAMKIRGYPSLAFFDDDGSYIQAISGYRTPEQLEIFLKMIASDDYKEVTTQEAWKEYQESFEGTFKDS